MAPTSRSDRCPPRSVCWASCSCRWCSSRKPLSASPRCRCCSACCRFCLCTRSTLGSARWWQRPCLRVAPQLRWCVAPSREISRPCLPLPLAYLTKKGRRRAGDCAGLQAADAGRRCRPLPGASSSRTNCLARRPQPTSPPERNPDGCHNAHRSLQRSWGVLKVCTAWLIAFARWWTN